MDVNAAELTTIAEGAGTVFLGRIAQSVLKYAYMILIAQMLGVEAFGLFVLGLTIVSFAGVISRMGLETGVIKYVAVYYGSGDKKRTKGIVTTALKFVLLSGLVVAAILFFGAVPLFRQLADKPQLDLVVKYLAISLPFMSFAMVAMACTRGFAIMKYHVYAIDIFMPLANLILAVALISWGMGLSGVVTAYVVSVLLTAVVSSWFLAKAFPGMRHIESISETRELFKVSIPLMLVLFFNFMIMWTDTLMLGYFGTYSDVGIYNAAIKTAYLISMILVSFNGIFGPIVSDLCNKKQILKLEELYKSITKWTYYLCVPMFLIMALLSKEILGIFGREFVAGAAVLTMLAFAQMANGAAGSCGLILSMSGHHDLMMYNTLGVMILNVILNFVLIPRQGMIGAATASAISLIVLNIAMLIEVYLLLQIHPYNSKFLKPSAAAIISFAFTIFLKFVLPWPSGLWAVITLTPLFLVIFTTLVFLWGMDDEDRLILGIIKAKLTRQAK